MFYKHHELYFKLKIIKASKSNATVIMICSLKKIDLFMNKELLKLVEKHEKPSTNKLELKIYEARKKDAMQLPSLHHCVNLAYLLCS
jgi:hypothetical protein